MRNIWKRSLSLLLAMVMVLSAVPMGALAEEVVEEEFFEEETSCDHASYGETGCDSPDCTTAGYIEYTCSDCGKTWTVEEEPYGHDYDDDGVCTSCGAVAPEGWSQEEIETYGVDYAVSTQAADLSVDMADIPEGEKMGLIWLDKNNPDALFACITSGGLPEVILKAIGEENTKDTKVYYGTADVSSYVQLFANGSVGDLTNALSNDKALPFTIKRTGEADKTVYIICRNIRSLTVEVNVDAVESKGCPTDLAGEVNKALANAKITINGDDELTKLALAKKDQVDIVCKSGSKFSWPETAGGSITDDKAIAVTITDDLGYCIETHYGSLTLKDTTATYTVTYYKVTGEKFKEYSVAEGSAIPVPEKDPERKYYTFDKWDNTTTGTVNSDLTFTAKWTPNLDKDGVNGKGDGIADQEQSYKVTFDYNYPEDATAQQPANVTVTMPWGTVISGYTGTDMPANPTLEGYVFQGWNGGTAKVTGNVTVTANWVKGNASTGEAVQEYTVTYHLMDGVTTFRLSTQGGKAIEVPYTSTKDESGNKNDYVIFKGWYADADYKTEYVFDNAVTADMHLYGLWLLDENNNGIEDGTAGDPYTIHRFWLEPKGTEGNALMMEERYFHNDASYDADFDPNSAKYKESYTPYDSLEDDDIFVKWELEVEGEDNQKVRNYYPAFTEEKNHNGIADHFERTALMGKGLNDDADYSQAVRSITFGGETVSFDALFVRDSKNPAELKITTNSNYVVTAVTYSEESNAPATTSLYEDEVIPSTETKLSELSYSEDNRTVTVTVPKLAASDSDSKYYALHIYFRDAQALVQKADPTLNLKGLSTITDEVVYNAAVEVKEDGTASPAYDADKVTIEYVAREAMSGKVDAQKLYDAVKPYENMVPGVWNYLVSFLELKQEGTRWYYYYDLEKVTCGLSDVTTIQRTPQQIVDNYIAEMAAQMDVTKIDDLVTTLVAKKEALEAQLESDTRHAFGSQSVETVDITYTEYPWTLTAKDVDITINDDREETSLAAPNMSFQYGKATRAAVIGKLQLSSNVSSDEITLSVDDFATRGVGTYTITASFAGDENRKSCSVEFNLTIEKASAKVKVPAYVVHQESFDFSEVKASVVDADGHPVDAAVLQIIAGLDATSLDLNLTAPVVSELTGKAWVIAPDGLDDLLEVALQKLGYDINETITLSQFTDLVTRHRDVLETRLSEANVDRLLSFLTKVSAYVDAQVNIVFDKPENVDVPTGVYLNLAVLADPNYKGAVDVTDTSSVNSETEFAYGGIVVSPVIAIPNRGGVQLVRESNKQAENIFAFGRDEKVELYVTVDGQKVDNATIHYYGVTGAAAVYNGTEAPKNAGLYVAATVYYSADGSKIGSDSAIVLVGKYEADMTIYNTVVAQKENKTFAPTYDVTRKDANKTKGNPDIIMISGTVTKANDSKKLDLKLLTGDVYVDVPQWLGNLWKTFVTSEAGRSFGLLDKDATDPVISKNVLTGFLNWCIERVGNTDDAFAEAIGTLNRLGVSDALTGKIDNIPDWLTNNLQKALEQAEKLPTNAAKIHIHTYTSADKTGNNHITHYGAVGVYYYVGIIADSDYLPAVAAGGLVITEDEDALVLWDTEVPVDFEHHEPIAVTKEGSMQVAMSVIRVDEHEEEKWTSVGITDDYETGKLYILMDQDLINAVGLKEGNTVTLNQLVGNKADSAQGKVDSIIGEMADLAKTKLPKRFGDNIEGGQAKLEELTEKLKDKMVKELQAAAGDKGEKEFTIKAYKDENLPWNIGVYQFYTFTYGMVYDTAELTIHDIYLDITPVSTWKYYGAEDPKFTADLKFYSYRTTLGDNGVETKEEVYENVVEDAYSYKIVRSNSDVNDVGSYPGVLKVEDAVSDNVKLKNLGTGDFEIRKATKELKLTEDLTKFYDGKHDDIEVTETLDDGTKVTYTLTYQFADAGEWELSVKEGSITVESGNYDVTVNTNGKKMIISPAKVYVKINDLSMTFEDVKSKLVSDLVNAYAVDTTKDNKGTTDLTGAGIALKVEALDSLASDAKLPIGTYTITGTKTSNNFDITFEEGTLTVSWGDYICWNMDTGVYYNDVSDALDAAGSGDTVQMLADATKANGKDEEYLTVSDGRTFDLNGYYVQAIGAMSFGGVIMDSEPMDETKNAIESTIADDGVISGGILVNSENLMSTNSSNGGYLPVYDTVTGSYKFFSGKVSSAKRVLDYGDNVVFYFQLLFDSAEGHKVLNRTGDSHMDVALVMTWPGISAFEMKHIMTSELVKTYASNAYNQMITANKNTQVMGFRIYGINKLNQGSVISAKPTLSTYPRVESESTVMTYTIP